MKPAYWNEAVAHLKRDPVMAGIIARFPQSVLKSRGAPFETLVRAVVGQQISVKAADSIWNRFTGLQVTGLQEDGTRGLLPQAVLKVPEEQLRACGLSGSKVKYIRGIAEGFVSGVVHPGLWQDMDDEHVIAELVKLPGIGRWTAEMFLIFTLMRPDVLPVDDLGLLKGFERAYGPVRGTAKLEGMKRWKVVAAAMKKHAGKHWAPYRTVATWLVWRSLDPVEVVY